MLTDIQATTIGVMMFRLLINLRKFASVRGLGDGLTNGGLSVVSYGGPELWESRKTGDPATRRKVTKAGGMAFAVREVDSTAQTTVVTDYGRISVA
jgi:hypothetical protein